mgnify:CR=1 FL=1
MTGKIAVGGITRIDGLVLIRILGEGQLSLTKLLLVTNEQAAEAFGLGVGVHPRKPRVQDKVAREIAAVDPGVDVVPDSGRLDERAGKRLLVGRLGDVLNEAECARQTAGAETLVAEGVTWSTSAYGSVF